jgi:glycosyltransferase involved in cell wall biosynthesis
MNVELYRIEEDIPWNLPGALNLAISAARTDWVLRTDSDFYFDEENLNKILNTNLDPNKSYFIRYRINVTDNPDAPAERDRHLGNAHLIHKRNWIWQGCQDEDFAGGYDFNDTLFNIKLERSSQYERLEHIKITQMLIDVAGHGPKTKTLYYRNRRMKAQKALDPNYLNNRSAKILRFPWVLQYVGVRNG